MNNKVGGLPGFSGVLEMQNGVVQKSDAMIKIALKIRQVYFSERDGTGYRNRGIPSKNSRKLVLSSDLKPEGKFGYLFLLHLLLFIY